jgi:hypothetical protein
MRLNPVKFLLVSFSKRLVLFYFHLKNNKVFVLFFMPST